MVYLVLAEDQKTNRQMVFQVSFCLSSTATGIPGKNESRSTSGFFPPVEWFSSLTNSLGKGFSWPAIALMRSAFPQTSLFDYLHLQQLLVHLKSFLNIKFNWLQTKNKLHNFLLVNFSQVVRSQFSTAWNVAPHVLHRSPLRRFAPFARGTQAQGLGGRREALAAGRQGGVVLGPAAGPCADLDGDWWEMLGSALTPKFRAEVFKTFKDDMFVAIFTMISSINRKQQERESALRQHLARWPQSSHLRQ